MKVQVQGTELQVKEYKGRRVVTFRDIDTVHQRPEGTASRNFRTNRQRFISGVDFYKITPDEFRQAINGSMDTRQQNDVTIITESGYLMLVKSFTDDLAWKVQRELVDSYFRIREHTEPVKQDIQVPAIQPEIFLEAARIMASVPDSQRYVINCLRHIVPDIDDVQAGGEVPVIEDRAMTIQTAIDRSYGKPFNSAQFDNYMVENKIKAYWLAVELDCSVTCISKWRYGNTRPENHNRIKLCEVLGLPAGYFDNTKRVRRIQKT